MTTTPILPDFLADVDEAERAALADLGLTLEPPPTGDQLAIEATAARYLRAMSAVQRDITHLESLRAVERAMVDDAYAPRLETLAARYATLERLVCHLATTADFGKKKSTKLAFGEFGRRLKKAAVKILDPKAAIAWAKLHSPTLVRIKETETIPHDLVQSHFDLTGELPEGCEFVPERDEPFAKPAAWADEEVGQ